jgi:TetR/AcrR family transcriptional regulator
VARGSKVKAMDFDVDVQTESDNGSGRTMTRQGKANKERILDAALSVFAAYGLRGSRLDQIADTAGFSKTNMLYYVKSKDELYIQVLSRTLELWLEPLNAFDAASDPRQAVTGYIIRKLELSRDMPEASRLFAYEIMQGAPMLGRILRDDLKATVDSKVALMQRWIDEGKMAKTDPMHLIFMIWATTQHYADFATQMRAVAGTDLTDEVFFHEAKKMLVGRLTGGLFP